MESTSEESRERVVIVGGHGKVALLAAPKLVEAGYEVRAIFRNPDHSEEVAATGAEPLVLDIEHAEVDALTEAFEGASAVVFSAGAGGGNPPRTHAVDFEAALRTMEAAQAAGVERYVMVSYITSEIDINHLDPENSFFPYAKAKHQADNRLRDTELDYTILGPGRLTLEPATKRIRVVEISPTMDRAQLGDTATSRDNVAEVIVHVLSEGAGRRQTINFMDGDTPIAEAIK